MLMSSSEAGVSLLASCPQAPCSAGPRLRSAEVPSAPPQSAGGHAVPSGARPLGGWGCGLLPGPRCPRAGPPPSFFPQRPQDGAPLHFPADLVATCHAEKATWSQKTGPKARPAGQRPPTHTQLPSALGCFSKQRPPDPPGPAGAASLTCWLLLAYPAGQGSRGSPKPGDRPLPPRSAPHVAEGVARGAQEHFRWCPGSHVL